MSAWQQVLLKGNADGDATWSIGLILSSLSAGSGGHHRPHHAAGGSASISLLVALQKELSSVASSVAALLKGSAPQLCHEVLSLIYAPVEDKISHYGSLEQAQLAAELASCPQPSAASCAEDLVAALGGCSKAALAVLAAAPRRCLALTGGTELRPLMRTMDQELSLVLQRLQAAVSELHARHQGGSGATPGAAAQPAPPSALGHGDDGEEVSGSLRLLLAYADISAGVRRLEAEIRCDGQGREEQASRKSVVRHGAPL